MERDDTYDFCRAYLSPGESVLWRGKPGKGHLLTKKDIFMIPFSLFWFGFVIFWEVGAITSAGGLFAGFGIPFVCVGLYLTVGRFFWTAFVRRKTQYVITDQKIIRSRLGKIDMVYGDRMPSVQLEIFRDGYGTICIGGYDYPNEWSRTRTIWSSNSGFCLENVPDVMRVQQYIMNMKK